MDNTKRKFKEIIALCKLEESIKDIYVEGNTDKHFIENFFTAKKVSKKVINIDQIDFSEIEEKYTGNLDLKSNRNKLIVLSKLLDEKTPETLVRCLIDRDFDEYIQSIENNKLLRTDYSCLESYLFCNEVIEKFINIGIGNFPFSANFILEQLAVVLKSLFCLRIIRQIKFPQAKLLTIDGNLVINKNTGEIGFSSIDYLDKFINKNNLSSQAKEIKKEYASLFGKLNIEIKHTINGHDFMDIFFLYINKIKNTPNYKKDNFERALLLTVESPMLEKYSLFQLIGA